MKNIFDKLYPTLDTTTSHSKELQLYTKTADTTISHSKELQLYTKTSPVQLSISEPVNGKFVKLKGHTIFTIRYKSNGRLYIDFNWETFRRSNYIINLPDGSKISSVEINKKLRLEGFTECDEDCKCSYYD